MRRSMATYAKIADDYIIYIAHVTTVGLALELRSDHLHWPQVQHKYFVFEIYSLWKHTPMYRPSISMKTEGFLFELGGSELLYV